MQVVREIDDHADIIGVEIVTDTTKYGGKAAQLVSLFYLLTERLIAFSKTYLISGGGSMSIVVSVFSSFLSSAFHCSGGACV